VHVLFHGIEMKKIGFLARKAQDVCWEMVYHRQGERNTSRQILIEFLFIIGYQVTWIEFNQFD
jgi:hypothetical protein